MGRQTPLCQLPNLTHPSPQFLGPSARPSGTTTGAVTEVGRRGPEGRVESQGQLTSDRKVCADFWAPMCNRYSYTYSANLQAGRKWLRLSGGLGSGQPQTPPSAFLEGPVPSAQHLPSVGQMETRGRGPTLSPHCTHPQPYISPPNTPLPPLLTGDSLLPRFSAWPTLTHPSIPRL